MHSSHLLIKDYLMDIAIIHSQSSPLVDEFTERMQTLNLLYYASEAAAEMEFDSIDELHESVKQAMDICLSAGVPIKGNFLRVYKSFNDGLTYDWKLSMLAYRLVCLNGKTSNPNVARLTIQLIKNEHINQL